MTSLLELKQYIKKFYIRYETYITYVWKFLLALISIASINSRLGYMEALNNVAIVMMAALLCAILPPNFIVFISALFVIGHLYTLGVECALIAIIVFLLMFLLYFRFSPKDTLAVLLTPLFFNMHIPYVMPLAMGLMGNPASIVSVSFGMVIAYMITYFSGNTTGFTLEGVEEAANGFSTMISGMFGDRSMIVMIVAFAVTLVVVYLIRRSSIDHSWRIAIAAGSVCLIVCVLVGDLMYGTVSKKQRVLISRIYANGYTLYYVAAIFCFSPKIFCGACVLLLHEF